MTPTKLGQTLDAIGTAGYDISTDCSQILGVNVMANLPDGERFIVMVTTSTQTMTIGTVTMFRTLGQMVTTTPSQGALSVSPFPLSDLRQIPQEQVPGDCAGLCGTTFIARERSPPRWPGRSIAQRRRL